jgi:hypothetical protein
MSESAVLLREVGDKFRLNLALQALGDIARSQGDGPGGAQTFYTDALACREMSRAGAIADAHFKLALTALDRGDIPEAKRLLVESLDGYRASESAEGMLWVLEGFALAAASVRALERAAILLGASAGRTMGGGIQFAIDDRERLERNLRDELGEERVEAALAKGAAMSVEDAFEYALAESDA